MDSKIATKARDSLFAAGPSPDTKKVASDPKSPNPRERVAHKFDDFLKRQADEPAPRRDIKRELGRELKREVGRDVERGGARELGRERAVKLPNATNNSPAADAAGRGVHKERRAARSSEAATPELNAPPAGLSLASPNLRQWGQVVQADPKALATTPVLGLLHDGAWERLEGQALPGLVAEHPFLTSMMSSDISDFMSQPHSVTDLAKLLGLSDDVMQQAAQLGLNLNEEVTPAQFFRSLGIDPSRVISEMNRLQDKLASSGLQSFLPQSQKLAGGRKAGRAQVGEGQASEAVGEQAQAPKSKQSKAELLAGSAGMLAAGGTSVLANAALQGAASTQPPDSAPMQARSAALSGQAALSSADLPAGMQAAGLTGAASAQQGASAQASLADASSALASKGAMAGPTAASGDVASNAAALPEGLRAAAQESQQAGASLSAVLKSTPAPRGGAQPNAEALPALTPPLGGVRAAGLLPKGAMHPGDDASLQQSSASSPASDAQLAQEALLALNLQQQTQRPAQGDAASANIDPQMMATQSPLSARELPVGLVGGRREGDDEDASLEADQVAGELPSNGGTLGLQPAGKAGSDKTAVELASPLASPRRGDELKHLRAYAQADKGQASDEWAPGSKDDSAVGKVRRSTTANSEQASAVNAPEGSVPTSTTAATGSAPAKSAPEGGFNVSPEAKAEMVEQIMDRSQLMLKQGGGSALVRLRDKDLGELSLAVQVTGDEVRLRMVSPSEEVRSVLGAELGQLKDSLAAQNMQLVEVDISKDHTEKQQQGALSHFAFAGQGQANPEAGSDRQRAVVKEELGKLDLSTTAVGEALKSPVATSVSNLQRHIQVMV